MIEDGAVRVGLKYVTGVGEDDAEAVVAARPYSTIRELAQRTGLSEDELRALVESGACDCFGSRGASSCGSSGSCRGRRASPARREAKQLALPLDPTVGDAGAARADGVGADAHRLPHDGPLGRRPSARSCCARICRQGRCRASELREQPHRADVQFAGLVVARQRPATANGVVLHAPRGRARPGQPRVPPQVYERFRAVVRSEPLLLVRGRYEHSDRNRNILVGRARLARTARAVADRRRRRPRRPPARAPLRAPLTSASTSRLRTAIGRTDWGRTRGRQ